MNGIDVQWEEYIINGGKECVYEREEKGRETQEPSGTSLAEFFRDFIK